MSQTIDDRIVALEFDNKQFERGVSESLTTLDKLKNSLDLKDAGKNLSKISQEANKVDLSHLSDSVDTLNQRFSALGIVGITALSNIVTGAMNLAKKLGSVLASPFKIAATGGWERAMKIEDAKFQIAGLKASWDDLFEDIDYAVSGTAYGLDSAAKAAASLTASGIKAGNTMKAALRGISGVAAMTNSAYEDISPIFTTVAGQGKLMTRQLRQLEMRGLNVAATMADAMHTTEAAVREMVSDGKIDFETFADAMDSAFGEHAKDANKTFTGALSNMKFALKKIGAEFATPLIQDSIQVFNSTRLMINAMKDNMGELFKIFSSLTKNITGKLSKSIDKITDFLNNRFTGMANLNRALALTVLSLTRIGNTIKSAFKQVFNGSMGDHVNNLARGIEKIAESLVPTDNALRGLRRVLVIIFSIIKKFGQAIGFIIKNVGGPILKIITKLIQGLLSLIGMFDKLTFNVKGLTKNVDVLDIMFLGLVSTWKKVKETFSNLLKILSNGTLTFDKVGKSISSTFNKIVNALKLFAGLSLVGVFTVLNKIRNINFSSVINYFKLLINNVKIFISNIKTVPEVSKAIDNIKYSINSLKNVFSNILITIKNFFSRFKKESSDTASSIRQDTSLINKMIGSFGATATIVGYISTKSALKVLTVFNKLFDFIKDFKIENVTKGITNFVKSIKDIGILETVANSAKKIGGVFGYVILKIIDYFKKMISEIKESGSIIDYLIDKIKTLISKIGEYKKSLNKDKTIESSINSTSGISKALESIGKVFTKIKNGVVSGLKKIREEGLLTKTLMVAWILAIIRALLVFTSNSKEMTKAMVEGTGMFSAFKGFGSFMKGLLNPFKSLSNLIDNFGEVYLEAHKKSAAEKFAIVMKSLALGLGVLAVSLLALYKVVDDVKKFNSIATTLGIFIGAMSIVAGCIASISTFVKDKDTELVNSFFWNMISMAAVINSLAKALVKLSDIPINKMAVGLTAISILFAYVWMTQLVISRIGKTTGTITKTIKTTISGMIKAATNIVKLTLAITLVSTSLILMAIAIKKIKSLGLNNTDNLNDVIMGITIIGLIFMAVITAAQYCKSAMVGILQLSGAMALLGVSAILILVATKMFKKVNVEDILKVGAIYGAILFLFQIITNTTKSSGVTKSVIAMGVTFSLLANAAIKLALVAKLMKNVNWKQIAKTISILAAIVISVGLLMNSMGALKNGQTWKPILASLIGLAAIIGAVTILSLMVSNDKNFLDIVKATGLVSLIMISFGVMLKSAGKIKDSKAVLAIVSMIVALGSIIGAMYLLLPMIKSNSDLIKIIGIAAVLDLSLLGLIKITESFLKFSKNNKLGNGKWMIKGFTSLGLMIVAFAAVAGIIIAVSKLASWYEVISISAGLSLALLSMMASMVILSKMSKTIKTSDLISASGTFAVMLIMFTVLGLVIAALSFIGADAKKMLAISQVIMLCLLELSAIAILLGLIPTASVATAALPALLGLTAVFAVLGLVLAGLSLIDADAKKMLATSQIIMLCLLELSAIATLLGLLPIAGVATVAMPALLLLTAIFAILGLTLAALSLIGTDAKKMLATSQVIMLCLLELSGICAILGLLGPVAAVAVLSEVALIALIGVMFVLGKLMAYLNEIDIDSSMPKLEKMKEFLWSLVGLIVVLGAVSMAGVAASVTLIALAAGITALAFSLNCMNQIEFDKLSDGIKTLLIPLTILMSIGLAGVPVGIGLIAFAAGIAALGGACLIAAIGVKTFTEALTTIGSKIAEASKSAAEGAQKIIDGFTEKFGTIVNFVTDTIDAVKDALSGSGVLGALKEAGTKMGGGLVNAFREVTGWHSPPAFIVKFFKDSGIAVNENAEGLTDLFEGTGETWGSALSKALGNNFDISAILEQLKGLFGDSELASMALDGLMNKLGATSKSIAQQRKELALLYRENKISHNEFMSRMKNLSEQEKKTEKTTDKLSSSFDGLTDSLNASSVAAASTTKSFKENLKSTLESQMNIFSKFEQNLDMSKEELLENMRSQIIGMSDWAAQMQMLATMGIDKGLYQKLAEMGPEGAAYVNAFANMTAEEMAEANSLWAQSLVLPNNLAKELNISWKSISKQMVNGLSKGWTDTAGIFHQNVLDTSQDAQDTFKEDNGIHSPSRVYQGFGKNLVAGLCEGIKSILHLVPNLIKDLSVLTYNTAVSGFASSKYYNIGSNISKGIADGISQNAGPIYNILAGIGAKADEVLRKVTQVRSPSRVFAEIGKYWDLGLVKGVDDNANAVYDSIEYMGNNAISTMKQTVAGIASKLIEDIDDPVIKPILDLSNVESGMKTLNGVFNRNRSIMASGKVTELQNAQGNTNPSIQFTQINNSPKALSRIDIYRDTRNLFAQAKGALS